MQHRVTTFFRPLLTAISLVLFVQCAPASLGPPPVDEEQLSLIIADLQLAEGLVGEIPVTLRDSMKQVYYERILAESGYTVAEFDSLMWIVRSEPEWLEAVFRKVSDEMAKREAESARIPPKIE